MANVLTSKPLVLDTPGVTNLALDTNLKVYKIVWFGTTIANGDVAKITRADNGAVIWQRTATANDATVTNQSIVAEFTDYLMLPSKGSTATGWTLNTLTHGTLHIYFRN